MDAGVHICALVISNFYFSQLNSTASGMQKQNSWMFNFVEVSGNPFVEVTVNSKEENS
jgi:hypothetical protein